jgi:hypothetical protein
MSKTIARANENAPVVENEIKEQPMNLSELAEAAMSKSPAREPKVESASSSSSGSTRLLNTWTRFETDGTISEQFVRALKNYTQIEGERVQIRIYAKDPANPTVRPRDWKTLCDAVRASNLRDIDRLNFDGIEMSDKHAVDLIKALERRRSKKMAISVAELSFRRVLMSTIGGRAWGTYFGGSACATRQRSISIWGKDHVSESCAVAMVSQLSSCTHLESITFADSFVTSERFLASIDSLLGNLERPLKALTLYDTSSGSRRVRSNMFCNYLRNDTMPAMVQLSAMFYDYSDYTNFMDAFEANTSTHSVRIAALSVMDEGSQLVYNMALKELSKRRRQGRDHRYYNLVMTSHAGVDDRRAVARTTSAPVRTERAPAPTKPDIGKLPGPSSPKDRGPPILVNPPERTLNSNVRVRRMSPSHVLGDAKRQRRR